MAYKDILVHLDKSDECQERIRAGILIAKESEASLRGLCPAVRYALPVHIQAYLIKDVLEQQEQQAREAAESAKNEFEKAVDGTGLSTEAVVQSCYESELTTVLSEHARSVDLVVLSQVNSDAIPAGGRDLPEDVAMACGRPVLLVPYIGFGGSIGRRVLVAWDGSREASRAVHDAMPILTNAESVVIMSVRRGDNQSRDTDQPLADIARHLARHGCSTEVFETNAGEISVADAIISRCADLGSDLLVMGAYGHTRLKETILGGVTRYVLGHMTVPTLLSH